MKKRGGLRSTKDLDAGNSVLEAIGPQAGDVLITDLHFAALKVHALKQADFMILSVLR